MQNLVDLIKKLNGYKLLWLIWFLLICFLLLNSLSSFTLDAVGLKNFPFSNYIFEYNAKILDFLGQPNLFWPFLPIIAFNLAFSCFIIRLIAITFFPYNFIYSYINYASGIAYWLFTCCVTYGLYHFTGCFFSVVLIVVTAIFSRYVIPFLKKYFGDFILDMSAGILS